MTTTSPEIDKYTLFNPDPFEAHALALSMLGDGQCILEVGSATGYITAELVARGHTVVGVEVDRDRAALAQQRDVDVRAGLVSDVLDPSERFDVVVLLDVVEHVTDPDLLIAHCRAHMNPSGYFVLSVPNVAHWSIRWALACGRFEYTRTGILDETHVRLYTRESLLSLLRRNGLEVTVERSSAGAGAYFQFRNRTLRWRQSRLISWLAQSWPGLFGYQFVWRADIRRHADSQG